METLSIQTLPIEIHVVKVGNRQMTKNIFKQIPLIDFIEFVKDILNVGTGKYKLIGFVKYRPESPDFIRNYIDNSTIVEAHLMYYDAMNVLYDSEGVYHGIDGCFDPIDYKNRMLKFISIKKRTPGIAFPMIKPSSWCSDCHELYLRVNRLVSVILIDNHKQNICRGYMPEDYLKALDIPQIYIAT